MALTRANSESILVSRCGSFLSAVGKAITVAGSNADLNDPLGWALRRLGYTVVSITSVADSDLAALASDEYDEYLDLAELRTLMNVQGNLTLVDVTLGPRSESLGQLRQTLKDRIEQLTATIKSAYGLGAASIEAGYIEYDFVRHGDDLEITS